MVALCTLDDVKQAQPVILHNDDDALLDGLIEAASEAILAYLDARASAVIGLDENGDLPEGASVPAAVRVATVFAVRHLYEGPDEMQARPGGIPYRAEMLLYRYADPPVA